MAKPDGEDYAMPNGYYRQREVVQIAPEDLKELIGDAVKTSMADCDPCPIPEEYRSEIGHAFGMLRDVGGGEAAKGLEVVRHNHEFTVTVRGLVSTFLNKTALAIMALFFTVCAGLLYVGATHWAEKSAKAVKQSVGG